MVRGAPGTPACSAAGTILSYDGSSENTCFSSSTPRDGGSGGRLALSFGKRALGGVSAGARCGEFRSKCCCGERLAQGGCGRRKPCGRRVGTTLD
jgi:hypothetical protein